MRLIIIMLSILFSMSAYAEDIKEFIKEPIHFDGRTYIYNDRWERYNLIESGNVDNDPENEIIISYAVQGQSDTTPLIPTNFFQIYDFQEDKYVCTTPGRLDQLYR